MFEDWLKRLGNLEGFQAILIILWDALQEESLAAGIVAEYIRQLINVAGTLDLSTPDARAALQKKMLTIVFDDVEHFQCQVRLGTCDATAIVTFRTLGNIEYLVEGHRGLKEDLVSAGAPESCFNSSNASADAPPSDCEMLAECINEVGVGRNDFFLARDAMPARRKRIVWFTHLVDLEQQLGPLGTTPRDPYAYRVRNWLGLGHMNVGEHLFAFVSTATPPTICGAALARPTVFDGIDNRWFKHRRGSQTFADRWGRALDLDRLNAAERRIDGGWEAVITGPRFAGQFRCAYIGRIKPPADKRDPPYDERALVQALLAGRSYEQVLAKIDELMGRPSHDRH